MEERKLKNGDFCIMAKEILARGLNLKFQAKGFSMSPFIKNGDILMISPFKGKKIGVGQVVAAVRPGTEEFIVHRAVGKSRGNYLIKGDNVPGPDGFFPGKNILGYVTKTERDGRPISFGLGSEKLLIAFLSRTGVLYYALRCLRSIIRLFKRRP